MTHAPGFIQPLAPIVGRYGYLAVFAAIFLEDFGIPLPGETTLIAASVFAGLGRLSFPVVLVVAFAAAVLGDNVGYAIGHFGGRPLVLRYGRRLMITEERLRQVEGFFERHGGKVVAVARFIEVLRQLNGIVAGLSGMPWRRFLLYNALGAALWVGSWGAAGYFAGDRLDAIYATVKRYELLAAIVIAAAALGLGVWRLLSRRRQHAEP